MRALFFACPLSLVLAACNIGSSQQNAQPSSKPTPPAAQAPSPAPPPQPLAAHDPSPGATLAEDIRDPVARPLMQAQVVLDRLGFTPGVVDGKMGLSTHNAIAGFQEASGLPQSGELDAATNQALQRWSNIPATRVVTIPADFAAGPFYKIPHDPQDQARMPSLGYESLDEKLAERFHTTLATLLALNPGGVPAGATNPGTNTAPPPSPSPSLTPSGAPGASPEPGPPSHFHAGQQIRVPNVGSDAIPPGSVKDAGWAQTLAMLGVGSVQPQASRVVVSKSKGTMQVFDEAGKLVAVYTATMGSTHDPLPLGEWKILGISHNPKFHYNPALFWDANANDPKATLPPGPNNPVGVVWIDISKPHYGIHGTPNPETIGRAESHGCVRLTNWDAARLAQMVSTKTELRFQA